MDTPLETKIRESQLQAWFVNAAQSQRVRAAITNENELTERIVELETRRLATEQQTLTGLKNAKYICELLTEARFLSENKNVSESGRPQMRPDVILFTDSAHYLLVELKTQGAAERQGIQELLGYGMALRTQYPFINDTVYVIAAVHWSELLRQGARALILDGKLVLPLRAEVTGHLSGENSFQLRVETEFFDFNFVQNFIPLHAFYTHSLAISTNRSCFPTHRYLQNLKHKILMDCQRISQTGFVLDWRHHNAPPTKVRLISVFAVDQHWLHSELTPTDRDFDMESLQDSETEGIGRIIVNEAGDAGSNGENPFDCESSYKNHSDFFPSNTYSLDVIQRNRDTSYESYISKLWHGSEAMPVDFAIELPCNLSLFLQHLVNENMFHHHHPVDFIPFGELYDFHRNFRKSSGRGVLSMVDFYECIISFCIYKAPEDTFDWLRKKGLPAPRR